MLNLWAYVFKLCTKIIWLLIKLILICLKINKNKMKKPLTAIQTINKTKSQIKALNTRLMEGKVKNPYAVQNKIKTLKETIKIEMDNHYWENYLSI